MEKTPRRRFIRREWGVLTKHFRKHFTVFTDQSVFVISKFTMYKKWQC